MLARGYYVYFDGYQKKVKWNVNDNNSKRLKEYMVKHNYKSANVMLSLSCGISYYNFKLENNELMRI